jgi:hypothetical protein
MKSFTIEWKQDEHNCVAVYIAMAVMMNNNFEVLKQIPKRLPLFDVSS